ncbi:prolyl-tRNA synthetase associated domain-containing protein [Amylibacter sp. SFDW26]|uniref:prolyl-tRNA synthetase associated domain-containing protein n=1 Tax=Amylibacter sp. SFDW26 TaxID=2652722 RepID=UPI00126225AC|nr:prolyl-tRNA synthetase associated domain-containing protein [Amylibacter sp. SFDW26]KAB7614581.1 prolyl-tRNA synthetase associated domain-containing protein [Amylibacter sp. SFDW26]
MSPEDLLKRLDQLGLAYQNTHHVALKTVEDSKKVQHQFLSSAQGGGHIKNLYLRDRKKRNYLVVAEQDQAIDLKALSRTIGATNLSFGSADRLMEHLGVLPGAVTPLSMIVGVEKGVTLFLDETLQNCKQIYMHPMVNTQTTAMSPADLEAFLKSVGCTYSWINLTNSEAS